MHKEIAKAIQNKQLVKLHYDGGERIIEPHCHGKTTAGNSGLRAFQVSGYSSSGKLGWKMFDLDKAHSIEIMDNTFSAPRPGYKKGDRGMSLIYCEI